MVCLLQTLEHSPCRRSAGRKMEISSTQGDHHRQGPIALLPFTDGSMGMTGMKCQKNISYWQRSSRMITNSMDQNPTTELPKQHTPAPYGAVIAGAKSRPARVCQDDDHLETGRTSLDCGAGSGSNASCTLLDELCDLTHLGPLALLENRGRLGTGTPTSIKDPVGILDRTPKIRIDPCSA
jgi:hypothetical protein